MIAFRSHVFAAVLKTGLLKSPPFHLLLCFNQIRHYIDIKFDYFLFWKRIEDGQQWRSCQEEVERLQESEEAFVNLWRNHSASVELNGRIDAIQRKQPVNSTA